MNEQDIIREAMKSRSYTQAMLADMLGYKGQNSVAQRLSGGDMRIGTFIKFLNALGYEVVVRDKNRSNKENTWIVGDDK
ncbi:MAG: helix-turn-helix transcriptional regulator [Oscillospiraceae bacterium]